MLYSKHVSPTPIPTSPIHLTYITLFILPATQKPFKFDKSQKDSLYSEPSQSSLKSSLKSTTSNTTINDEESRVASRQASSSGISSSSSSSPSPQSSSASRINSLQRNLSKSERLKIRLSSNKGSSTKQETPSKDSRINCDSISKQATTDIDGDRSQEETKEADQIYKNLVQDDDKHMRKSEQTSDKYFRIIPAFEPTIFEEPIVCYNDNYLHPIDCSTPKASIIDDKCNPNKDSKQTIGKQTNLEIQTTCYDYHNSSKESNDFQDKKYTSQCLPGFNCQHNPQKTKIYEDKTMFHNRLASNVNSCFDGDEDIPGLLLENNQQALKDNLLMQSRNHFPAAALSRRPDEYVFEENCIECRNLSMYVNMSKQLAFEARENNQYYESQRQQQLLQQQKHQQLGNVDLSVACNASGSNSYLFENNQLNIKNNPNHVDSDCYVNGFQRQQYDNPFKIKQSLDTSSSIKVPIKSGSNRQQLRGQQSIQEEANFTYMPYTNTNQAIDEMVVQKCNHQLQVVGNPLKQQEPQQQTVQHLEKQEAPSSLSLQCSCSQSASYHTARSTLSATDRMNDVMEHNKVNNINQSSEILPVAECNNNSTKVEDWQQIDSSFSSLFVYRNVESDEKANSVEQDSLEVANPVQTKRKSALKPSSANFAVVNSDYSDYSQFSSQHSDSKLKDACCTRDYTRRDESWLAARPKSDYIKFPNQHNQQQTLNNNVNRTTNMVSYYVDNRGYAVHGKSLGCLSNSVGNNKDKIHLTSSADTKQQRAVRFTQNTNNQSLNIQRKPTKGSSLFSSLSIGNLTKSSQANEANLCKKESSKPQQSVGLLKKSKSSSSLRGLGSEHEQQKAAKPASKNVRSLYQCVKTHFLDLTKSSNSLSLNNSTSDLQSTKKVGSRNSASLPRSMNNVTRKIDPTSLTLPVNSNSKQNTNRNKSNQQQVVKSAATTNLNMKLT